MDVRAIHGEERSADVASRLRLFQRHLQSLVWVWIWVWDWIHWHTSPRTRSPSSRHPPFIHYPFSPPSLVCDGQTSPHQPRLVISHSTCSPLSSSPHSHSFVIIVFVSERTNKRHHHRWAGGSIPCHLPASPGLCVCMFITAVPIRRVPKGYMAQGYLLFLQEQKKDIIIIIKAVRVGGGGEWRTYATRDDEPKLVWTRLPITH